MARSAIASIIMLLSSAAQADDAVTVLDLSQLSWQIHSSGKVYLMNLSQFDSSFLGCCYNFYIDTSTAAGRAMWSAVLANTALEKRLTFYVSSKTTPEMVTFLGN